MFWRTPVNVDSILAELESATSGSLEVVQRTGQTSRVNIQSVTFIEAPVAAVLVLVGREDDSSTGAALRLFGPVSHKLRASKNYAATKLFAHALL